MPSFALIAQLFAWGEALMTKGKPLIDDVVAAFKKHDVESDLQMVLDAAADAKARRERREAELDQ
jgi:hypothetical protein